MKVTLLHNTPLWVCARAIRTCWDSHDKSDSKEFNPFVGVLEPAYLYKGCANNVRIGEKDKELIARVGNKNKHSSTLEHLVYSFEIDGISRACLQELARHRMASYSVKSSRYTLKELKKEEPFTLDYEDVMQRARKYVVFSEDSLTNIAILEALNALRVLVCSGESNDIIKYAMPESYKTQLVWTINARSLQNFLSLRTSKSALKEIRELAYAVFNALPEDHKYLFEEFLQN